MAFLLDTSVFVASERHLTLDGLGVEPWALSAMTIAELNIGVLTARGPVQHQRRLRTFELATRCEVLEFDETTARTYAEIVAWAGSIGVRPTTPDGIIAATAATNGLTLVTLDRGFERLADFDGLELLVVD